MREDILDICADALRRDGHPGATRDTILADAAQRAAALALLRDCRPLPVIRRLIAELEGRDTAAG